jgi:hypothetical protein
LPPERSIGTWPSAIKVNFFIKPVKPGEVKYSLFARKVTLRGTTSGIKIESLNERWFEAMITAPLVGTFRSPVTFGLKSNIKSGIKKDFNNRYAISPNLLAKGIYDTI